jgi:hypothetical protein
MKNPLLIHKTSNWLLWFISNEKSIANIYNGLLIVEKSATTDLYLIFFIANFVTKFF